MRKGARSALVATCTLLAALALACGKPRPVAPLAPLAGPRTCQAKAPARPVSVKVDEPIGYIDGVRYFLGQHEGTRGLIWLQPDGTVAAHALPFRPRAQCMEEPGGLRCFRIEIPAAGQYHLDTTLETAHVAIAGGKKPIVGKRQRWSGVPWMRPTTYTSSGERALLVFREYGDSGRYHVGLWDVHTGRRMGPLHAVGWMKPTAVWCHKQRCVLLASRYFEKRRAWLLASIQVSDRGRRITRVNEDENSPPIMVQVDERRFLIWERRWDGRVLISGFDPDGRQVVRPRTSLYEIVLRDATLRALPGEGRFLFQSYDGWAIASLNRDGRLNEPRWARIRTDKVYAGLVGDGFAVAGIDQFSTLSSRRERFIPTRREPIYEVVWVSTVDGYFIADPLRSPDKRRPSVPLTEGLPTEGTDSRGGGYEAQILTRPDRAAALVTGKGQLANVTRLVPLREPCPDGDGAGEKPAR